MRRFFTAILLILIVVIIILGGRWVLLRRQAVKSGQTPTTFRQFVGLGNSKPADSIKDNSLSSDFTNPNGSNRTGNNETTEPTTTKPIKTSQFTTDTIMPNSATPLTTQNIESAGKPPKTTDITVSTTATGGPGALVSTASQGPVCGDADLNITFTPDELSRLKVLEKRFNDLAPSLRDELSVQTELDNYDLFKEKEGRIREMYAYCQAQRPKLTNPIYQRSVPTPFWNGNSVVTSGFINPGPLPYGRTNVGILNNLTIGEASLERQLRLNLW
jgi:hypothetical protein